jgi:hypothetical protein
VHIPVLITFVSDELGVKVWQREVSNEENCGKLTRFQNHDSNICMSVKTINTCRFLSQFYEIENFLF